MLTVHSTKCNKFINHIIGLRQILRIELRKRSNFPSSIRVTKMFRVHHSKFLSHSPEISKAMLKLRNKYISQYFLFVCMHQIYTSASYSHITFNDIVV